MVSRIFGFGILCLCGTAGCLLFRMLRLPLPALLGSLTATATLAMLGFFPATAPVDSMSMFCKVAIGVMMGRRINRQSLKMIVKLASPALLVSIWMILLSIASGQILALLANIPLSTALIGCTTGGVSEMAIFALSKEYDVATITVIQTFRLAGTLALTPWLARKWSARLQGRGALFPSAESVQVMKGGSIDFFPRNEMFGLLALATAGGLVFHLYGVPAGAMLGALVFSGAACIVRNKTYLFPQKITSAAQIGIGIAIAQQFGPDQVEMLTNIRFLLSTVASTGFIIAGTLLLGFILQKMTGWNPLTCLLSTSAGGLSQMVIVAEEMNADSLTIGILHLARYLAIVSCMPFLITYLLP